MSVHYFEVVCFLMSLLHIQATNQLDQQMNTVNCHLLSLPYPADANTFNGVISISQESTGFGFCSSGTDISFMVRTSIHIHVGGVCA